MDIKICIKCKEFKTLEHFHKDKNRHLGVHVYCKACKAIYDKTRKQTPKLWSELTEEQKLRRSEYSKLYRLKNKVDKPPRVLKTREEKLAKKRIREARWRASSPYYKIMRNVRKGLKRTLKRHIKSGFTSIGNMGRIMGCSGNELIKHIEATWTEGMSWSNYGWGKDKWVIDHIRPLISFVRSKEDPKKANHYTNLRALWYTDNAKKAIKDRDEVFSSDSTTEHEPEFDNEGVSDTVINKDGQ